MAYAEIYYNKKAKTQRLVIAGANDCTATIDYKLSLRNIDFTGNKFIGRYKEGEDYKEKTYKYAQKWTWLDTIDVTE